MSPDKAFKVELGHDSGLHCHLGCRHNGKYHESGWMLTLIGDVVYAESHGRPVPMFSITKIGKRRLDYIIYEAKKRLAKSPLENRRRPSLKAVQLSFL